MIVVVGSLSYDYVMNYPGRFKDQILPDKIHVLNLSFLTDKLRKNFGGTAGNIAYNFCLLGGKVRILGCVGRDFGVYRNFLEKAGVDTKSIRVYKREYTSNYFAVVDKDDNQIGGFYAGAMRRDRHLSLRKAEGKVEMVVISPTDPEAMVKIAKECKLMGIPYMFDPGMQLPRMSRRQLEAGLGGAEILIGNDYEVGLMGKKLGVTKRGLLKRVSVLVTTLAGKGSIVEGRGRRVRIRVAKPKGNIDPVGAGDAYRAGFVRAWLLGYDFRECGQMGSVAAVYTVEKEGSTTHRYKLGQFLARYKKNYKKTLPLGG